MNKLEKDFNHAINKMAVINRSAKSRVSNSDMIKKYKSCRDKAESKGQILILKNNEPDAVLFSIKEYERISAFIEYMENLEEKDIARQAI